MQTASKQDFDIRNKAEWHKRVKALFKCAPPESSEWSSIDDIIEVVNHFCGDAVNHTMLPKGGGMDIIKATASKEEGCLELRTSESTAYVCRPDKLIIEYFADSPWNTFLLLSTKPLAPSGEYDDLGDDEVEELLELPDGTYMPRTFLDAGYIGHDERGCEIPVPKKSRLICRYPNGQFLMVAKRSYWNRIGDTYDGRHNTLSSAKIRAAIHLFIKTNATHDDI